MKNKTIELLCKIAETRDELDQAFALRVEVFVMEQDVPVELELDELDKIATHFIATHEQKVIGCGRIVMAGSEARIGRVAVKKCYRCKGVGRQLMMKMIDTAINLGATEITLHAQIQVVPFYESLGFSKFGNIFLDAGIEHIEMRL